MFPEESADVDKWCDAVHAILRAHPELRFNVPLFAIEAAYPVCRRYGEYTRSSLAASARAQLDELWTFRSDREWREVAPKLRALADEITVHAVAWVESSDGEGVIVGAYSPAAGLFASAVRALALAIETREALQSVHACCDAYMSLEPLYFPLWLQPQSLNAAEQDRISRHVIEVSLRHATISLLKRNVQEAAATGTVRLLELDEARSLAKALDGVLPSLESLERSRADA